MVDGISITLVKVWNFFYSVVHLQLKTFQQYNKNPPYTTNDLLL